VSVNPAVGPGPSIGPGVGPGPGANGSRHLGRAANPNPNPTPTASPNPSSTASRVRCRPGAELGEEVLDDGSGLTQVVLRGRQPLMVRIAHLGRVDELAESLVVHARRLQVPGDTAQPFGSRTQRMKKVGHGGRFGARQWPDDSGRGLFRHVSPCRRPPSNTRPEHTARDGQIGRFGS
jgi:hypothetical protein